MVRAYFADFIFLNGNNNHHKNRKDENQTFKRNKNVLLLEFLHFYTICSRFALCSRIWYFLSAARTAIILIMYACMYVCVHAIRILLSVFSFNSHVYARAELNLQIHELAQVYNLYLHV